MTSWAEASLLEAMALLLERGRLTAANDIKRVLAAVDFGELSLTRHPGSDRVIDATAAATSLADLLLCLGRTAALVGVQHATVHLVCEAPGSTFRTRVLTTYPSEWIERYVKERYHSCDPVQDALLKAAEGFYWSDLAVESPYAVAFLRDAETYRIGPRGYSQPVRTDEGDMLALSLATTEMADTFRFKFENYREDVRIISSCLVEAFVRLVADPRSRSPILHDKQISLLRAVAAGEDELSLRRRTFDGESFDSVESRICALLNSRTIAQAAVIAAELGLLVGNTLSKPDILSSESFVGSRRDAGDAEENSAAEDIEEVSYSASLQEDLGEMEIASVRIEEMSEERLIWAGKVPPSSHRATPCESLSPDEAD